MQHIKEQNWFAVGLDVIVVIVGIFLGMQVQQWYEEQQNLTKEDEIYSLLLNESSQRLNYFDDYIAFIDSKIASQEASIQALIEGELPKTMTHDEFVRGVTLTRFFSPPSPPNSIYQSIITSGEVRLLRNKQIVQALGEFQSRLISTVEYAERMANSRLAQEPYHPAIKSIYDPSRRDKRRQSAHFEDLVGDEDFLRQSIDILRMVAALQERRKALFDYAKVLHSLICEELTSEC
jgi:hypothetical protein